ncbi:M20 family metallopeptidase [Dictyobacter kobayashii]|uniref:Glutamate carboxypeptidase n=1 Tax=Dictyobacter kobayashii TaxID=2014872 RepID=A0A402AHY0_9CHLR|nr:M20 family metallopeptidase [Dictyobacter kobayashii]GCE18732.1 glutamate carboxypeptidase [Dictyobacter kobayashii]
MPKSFFVEQAESLMEPFFADLQAMVNIDSGTYVKAGVDRLGLWLQRRFQGLGFDTYFDEQQEYGNHLVAVQRGNNPQGARLLLIGHMDTVFPADEAVRRPFSRTQLDGIAIAKGPGVLDMKSGVLIGIYAVQLLLASHLANYQSITFVCNSDEEVGSRSSRSLIGKLARESDAVLVLEPGRIVNRVVSARRGIANYRVEAHGLSSHAGVEPEKGRNAILELSHQVIALQAINGTIPGATLNVGIIKGGERTNIVPDYAYCDIDVRVSDRAGLKAIEEAMRQVTSHTVLDGTSIVLSGGVSNMPFERTEESLKLVRLAQQVGAQLGLQIEDVSSGGASDANTTAGLGVPTIDGLGATGGLAHNPDEYIEVDQLPVRIALVSGLLQRLCE